MNADSVNRIVALTRQMATVRSMVKRGELTEAEAGLLIGPKEAEIARIRAQSELDVKPRK